MAGSSQKNDFPVKSSLKWLFTCFFVGTIVQNLFVTVLRKLGNDNSK